MANYDVMDRLLATAKIRLPGSTSAAINLELFNTIDEFFRESSAWRYELTVPLAQGEDTYPIFAPAGTSMVQVMGASYNGRQIQAYDGNDETTINQRGLIVGTVQPDFDAIYEPGESVSEGGVFSFSIFYPSYITITVPASASAAEYPIQALLALTLSPDVLDSEPNEWPLEPWMHQTYHEAWLNGLQSKMMSQLGKPYSNPQMALVHGRKFRQLVGRAKQTVNRGYQYNTPRWTFPRWAQR